MAESAEQRTPRARLAVDGYGFEELLGCGDLLFESIQEIILEDGKKILLDQSWLGSWIH